MMPADFAALSMPFSSPFELQRPPKKRVLLETPHLEPRGFVVAVMGDEIVAQLLTNAHASATANTLNVFFISFRFIQ